MSLTISNPLSEIEQDKLIKNNKEDIKGTETNKNTPNLKKIREYFLKFIKLIIFNILYFQPKQIKINFNTDSNFLISILNSYKDEICIIKEIFLIKLVTL